MNLSNRTTELTPQSPDSKAVAAVDVHGRHTLFRSVMTSWMAQGVLIFSGFIVPRLIDRNLGSGPLGVWDFAWSVVSYFTLVQVGIVSSVSRYVAIHRGRSDLPAINRAVSSVALVLRAMAGVIVILAIVCSIAAPWYLRESLSGYAHEARCIILLLGLSMAMQTATSVYSGILTGSHRWDLHNGIYAACNLILLVGLSMCLILKQGLIALAATYLCTEVLGRVARIILAYRIVPGLEISWRHFQLQTAREMAGFGGKNFITSISNLLLHQSINILILSQLGTVALALYARPQALIRSATGFIQKFAVVLTPTVSSMHGSGQSAELRQLVIRATQYCAHVTLPVFVTFILAGGAILHVWMGEKFVDARLFAMLAAGSLVSVTYLPLLQVAVGLNVHGRLSVVNLLGAAGSFLLAYLSLRMTQGGTLGVAIAVGVPMSFINAIYLPLYVCSKLGMSYWMFTRTVWLRPLLCVAPFASCLAFVVWQFGTSRWVVITFGFAAGGVALLPVYWRYVVPPQWKHKLLSRVYRWHQALLNLFRISPVRGRE